MKNKLTSIALSLAMFAAIASTPVAASTAPAPIAPKPQPATCAFTYTTKEGATLRTSDSADGITVPAGTTICVPPGPSATRAALKIMATKALANATYSSEVVPGGTVTLKNGKYSVEAAPGSASMITVQMTRYVAYGTLDSVPSAAVVLASSGGGTGTFYSLHVMQVKDGKPTEVAITQLGDRIKMKSLAIKNNQILISYVKAGPDDAACCPTQAVTEAYTLQNGQLVASQPTAPTPSTKPTTPTASLPLVGTTWNWMAFKDTAQKNDIVVDQPQNYTLLLNPDGTASIRADCNQVTATYVVSGSQLTIKLGASTMAFCGENSLDQKYLMYLSNVATYVMSGPKLVLNLQADAGNMEFGAPATTKPAPAPKPEAAVPPLVGTTWNWLAFKDTAQKNDITVSKPQNYTLLLNPDGTANIKADCNQVQGTYVLNGSQLTIKLGASTRAFCGENSLDQKYLAYLSNVVAYVMSGSKLVLNLKYDSGNMEFGAAAAAAKPAPPASGATPLVGTTWQWQSFKGGTVPKPQNYTLLLMPAGKVSIKADCNQVAGTYTLNGDQLTIKLGPSTMAFCGEDSLDLKYLGLLSSVATYKQDGASLILNLKDNGGDMTFGAQAK